MSDTANKSLPQILSELWDLTRDYARQETIDPLKGAGRYLAYGLAGAVVGGTGVVLLLVALLRLLQAHTGTALTGSWSWAPYAIVLAVSVLLVGLAGSRISKSSTKR